METTIFIEKGKEENKLQMSILKTSKIWKIYYLDLVFTNSSNFFVMLFVSLVFHNCNAKQGLIMYYQRQHCKQLLLLPQNSFQIVLLIIISNSA